jgi:hypothetical protein
MDSSSFTAHQFESDHGHHVMPSSTSREWKQHRQREGNKNWEAEEGRTQEARRE